MRLFVAIEIDPTVRDRIAEFASRLKPHLSNARWSRPEGLHITLKFLGNVSDDKRSSIEGKLRSINAQSFSLSVRDAGVFPNAKSPRVLWVGLDAPKNLADLAGQIDAAMGELGFVREKRAFTPHVTLARFSDRDKRSDASAALSATPKAGFGTMTATEFHLYESKLSPQGSRYIKLATFALR
jgi:2'-5' RNA ligase